MSKKNRKQLEEEMFGIILDLCYQIYNHEKTPDEAHYFIKKLIKVYKKI